MHREIGRVIGLWRYPVWHYRPFFATPAKPDASAVLVRTPSGEVYDVTDPKLAAELGNLRVQKQDRGIFDSMPLSLITTKSRRWSQCSAIPAQPARRNGIGRGILDRATPGRVRVDDPVVVEAT